MSVLVKGMKMPNACFWRDKNGSLTICPLCDTDGYCGANGKQRCLVPENEMPNDCPLIELPPHGDLIDRDALKKYIENTYCQKCKRDKILCHKNCDYGDFMEELDYAPVILEANR